MRRWFPVWTLLLAWAAPVHAHGLLIPDDKTIPPLAMLNHRVTITLEDQVAVTQIEQTFRNHTDRPLEATYVFPVPKGASVDKFSMWVNDKEVTGELVEANKAREIYTNIVRRTQDPGLLEYLDNNLFRLRVFPVPAKGDQKVTLSYTSVVPQESGVIEYVYPLKTNGKATSTLEQFSLQATLRSQHSVQNIYSPTHALSVERQSDREAKVRFQHEQALLDKDFQLMYTLGKKDVGMTALTHRPAGADGYFLLLVSPRAELPADQILPRDLVLVLDTSGSMAGAKMEQARKALKFFLNNLNEKDRFGLLNFSTTVHKYTDTLTSSNRDEVARACKWVDKLQATGGTAIDDALQAALAMRTGDDRPFTIVFFTDGEPTIGECKPEAILKNVMARNTANTRIFTFGVGDDVNATLLDQLAEKTRAACTYVRPEEDIEVKVSNLYGKISQPVLVNLKLTATKEVDLQDVYPPRLPDLFQGGQLMVLGRYSGKGPARIILEGTAGKETREFVYEVDFPEKTGEERAFVEQVWARRKVGYLLDQIRINGENKELVNEVLSLAKKYGIATPYTSYLIVPDAPMPVAGRAPRGKPVATPQTPSVGSTQPISSVPTLPAYPPVPTFGMYGGGYQFGAGGQLGGGVTGLGPQPSQPTTYYSSLGQYGQLGQFGQGGGPAMPVLSFARTVQATSSLATVNRGKIEGERLNSLYSFAPVFAEAQQKKEAYEKAHAALERRQQNDVQVGKLGVDLSVQADKLRDQSRLAQSPLRQVAGRRCLEIDGAWIDQEFNAKTETITVKALSAAYFRLLEKQPQLKEVFQLGNYLVWITPSGTALVVDLNEGKEELADGAIDKLFVGKK